MYLYWKRFSDRDFIASFFVFSSHAWGGTSVIVSGRMTANGKPLMLKHRDTGFLDNKMEWYQGKKYTFIGLVNSSIEKGEIWSGTNDAGFCIMNTATYDLKDDDVPEEMMDKEGVIMYRALGCCGNLQDFENFLDTLSRPLGAETNFGVIDAEGGAAYYEVDNWSWTKFDVNAIDCGYRVVTNFTATGRVADRKGVDRFERAGKIMCSAPRTEIGRLDIDPMWLIDHVTRSGAPILRDITSASVVFEGVSKGELPLHTVMWTALGYPETTVTIPLMVLDADYLPWYVRSSEKSAHAEFCDNALNFKGSDKKESILQIEGKIALRFDEIFSKWASGRIEMEKYVKEYNQFLKDVYELYGKDFLNE